MGLFEEPLAQILAYREQARRRGQIREFGDNPFAQWPEKSSLVLQEDTLVELGSAAGSLFMVLWTGGRTGDALQPGRITLVGPDVDEVGPARLPFVLLALVKGRFTDEYETYRELRDRIFDTKPEGLSMRIWPDRQKIWCRIGKKALERGFNLARYGRTLLKNLGSLEGVAGAEIIFITGAKDEWEALLPIARRVQETVEALIKMYEGMNFDCAACEYNEVCAEVATLREIRERLQKERRAR